MGEKRENSPALITDLGVVRFGTVFSVRGGWLFYSPNGRPPVEQGDDWGVLATWVGKGYVSLLPLPAEGGQEEESEDADSPLPFGESDSDFPDSSVFPDEFQVL